MNGENTLQKEMNAFSRIIGIFYSPKETFESIDRKPTWLVPFIIILILTLAITFVTMDIGIQDRIAAAQANGAPEAQIDAMQNQMSGNMKYISLAFIPIASLAVWAIIAAILLFFGKTVSGGNAGFKTVFSMLVWSDLISILGGLVKGILIYLKGSTHGITTSLAMLMNTPPVGEKGSLIYRILGKLDFFTIWLMILWIIGSAVVFKISTKKSATMIIIIWVLWTAISLALANIIPGGLG